MSREADVLLELYVRHLKAAMARDEPLRKRLVALIDEMAWAFPEADAELHSRYPSPA